jgi:2-phosphoglycerate kinase
VDRDLTATRAALDHVYWIGGGSGGGKSTIARRLAAEHGLHHYATDDVMPEHAGRTTPEDSPYLSRFGAMDMDERWVNRSPETMLATFHWFLGEGFDLIIEDLLRLPRRPEVVVDGFRLLPDLVRPLAAPRHAVWLLPTPGFRETAFQRRGSTWTIAGKTSDPRKALANLLHRDRIFTERLRRDTTRLDLPAIEVDADLTEDELTRRVAVLFGV